MNPDREQSPGSSTTLAAEQFLLQLAQQQNRYELQQHQVQQFDRTPRAYTGAPQSIWQAPNPLLSLQAQQTQQPLQHLSSQFTYTADLSQQPIMPFPMSMQAVPSVFNPNQFSVNQFQHAFAYVQPLHRTQTAILPRQNNSSATAASSIPQNPLVSVAPRAKSQRQPKQKNKKPTRPPNAFILYRRDKEAEFRGSLKDYNEQIGRDSLPSSALFASQIDNASSNINGLNEGRSLKIPPVTLTASAIAELWKNEDEHVRDMYKRRALAIKDQFRRETNPNYGEVSRMRKARRSEFQKLEAKRREVEKAIHRNDNDDLPSKMMRGDDNLFLLDGSESSLHSSSQSLTSSSFSNSASLHSSNLSGIRRLFGSGASSFNESRIASSNASTNPSLEDLQKLYLVPSDEVESPLEDE